MGSYSKHHIMTRHRHFGPRRANKTTFVNGGRASGKTDQFWDLIIPQIMNKRVQFGFGDKIIRATLIAYSGLYLDFTDMLDATGPTWHAYTGSKTIHRQWIKNIHVI